MKDAITYANDAGFFAFNVIGWKAEFERLIEAVRAERELVDLTDEEMLESMMTYCGGGLSSVTGRDLKVARAVIAAFKEKNK